MIMKKNNMTFKWFGKKYRVVRGGNLHLALEFGQALLPFIAIGVFGVLFVMLGA